MSSFRITADTTNTPHKIWIKKKDFRDLSYVDGGDVKFTLFPQDPKDWYCFVCENLD